MYAPLLTRLSTGIASAFTPLFNWAIRFSWSHRSLARNTISDGRRRPVVGDVEEVPVRLEQPQLALLHHQLLAEHHHPVRLLAGDGPVLELGHLLTDQLQGLELPLGDDPLPVPLPGLAGHAS